MILNEDLFEIEIPVVDPEQVLTVDNIEQPSPSTPEENGTATMLINSISDTWNKISDYNSIISTLSSTNVPNAENMINVVKDVVDNENENVGKLMAALKSVSPNTENVKVGEEEATEKLTEDCWAVFATDKSTGKEYCDAWYDTEEEALRNIEFTKNGDSAYKYGNFDYYVEQIPEVTEDLFKSSIELNDLKLKNASLHEDFDLTTEEGKKDACDRYSVLTQNNLSSSSQKEMTNLEDLASEYGLKFVMTNEHQYNLPNYTGKPKFRLLKEDLNDDKLDLISDVLGRSISSSQQNYIYDGWRAFYNDPESFRNTVVVDLVNKGLDTQETDTDDNFDIDTSEDDFEIEEGVKMTESLQHIIGTDEYDANEGRKRRIAQYRRLAHVNEGVTLTEDMIDDWALSRTACFNNRSKDQVKAEILGERWSEFEE